jgi:hypothetical protein
MAIVEVFAVVTKAQEIVLSDETRECLLDGGDIKSIGYVPREESLFRVVTLSIGEAILVRFVDRMQAGMEGERHLLDGHDPDRRGQQGVEALM